MFCSECGAPLDDNAVFCNVCGAMVTPEAAQQSPGQQGPEQQIPMQQGPEQQISTGQMPPQIPSSVLPDFRYAGDGPAIEQPRQKHGAVIALSIAIAVMLAGIFFTATVVFGGVDGIKSAHLCSLGSRYLSELEYEEAVAAYEDAIAIEPKLEKAYVGLADAYVGMEDYASAIEALERGIDETGSESLQDYRDEIQGEWDDHERRLCGTVYAVDTDLDDSNNAGLAGLTVTLTDDNGDSEIYVTDDDGSYETDLLEKGTYSVYFYLDGFVDYECEMELTGGREELDVYLEPDATATLFGSIHIADADMDYTNNTPLEGAHVSLEKLTGSNSYETEISSDNNGQYEIDGLWMGVYKLVITKDGYITAEENVTIYEGQSVSYNTIVEMIDTEWDGMGTASGKVYDALTGSGVPGLTLTVREGISTREGSAVEVLETDGEGRYQTSSLDCGNYCIEITDERDDVAEEERYGSSLINIKILGSMDIDNQDGTVSNTIMTGQVRIVLTWGELPYDLDSHLQCDLNSGDRYHIFYMEPTFTLNGVRIADLDLDDTTSYGPETTTIYVSDPGEYTFGVYNYSHNNSDELASSGACVQVYVENSQVPAYVFYVPRESGYYWEVFQYNSVTGVLTPTNVMQEEYAYGYNYGYY